LTKTDSTVKLPMKQYMKPNENVSVF